MLDLVRQRLFQIAAGYEDCNDVARPKDDPMPRMLLGRDPLDGDDIAYQPTLSRTDRFLLPRSAYAALLVVKSDAARVVNDGKSLLSNLPDSSTGSRSRQ